MRKTFRTRSVGAVLAMALLVTACGSGDDAEPIVISSANFNESVIVAEIYAQALEEFGGFEVERKLNLGSREVSFPALETGEIDVMPEYIGALDGFLGGSPTGDSFSTYEEARDLAADRGVSVLGYSPAQDKDALVVTSQTASELGISKTSDLSAIAGDLVFGGPPECPEREFCMIGLKDVYGIEFGEFKPLDVAGPLTVAALESGDIDVARLFSSQGIISANGWVLLEDDRGLNPAQNIAPVVRTELVDEYGRDLTNILEAVSALLNQEDLTEMNKRADLDGEDPALIAGEWLDDQELGLDN